MHTIRPLLPVTAAGVTGRCGILQQQPLVATGNRYVVGRNSRSASAARSAAVRSAVAVHHARRLIVCFRQRCKTRAALRKPPQHGGDLAPGGCSGEQEERRDPAAVRLSRAALQPRWRRQPRRGPAPRYSSKASTRTDQARRSPHGAVE